MNLFFYLIVQLFILFEALMHLSYLKNFVALNVIKKNNFNEFIWNMQKNIFVSYENKHWKFLNFTIDNARNIQQTRVEFQCTLLYTYKHDANKQASVMIFHLDSCWSLHHEWRWKKFTIKLDGFMEFFIFPESL